MSDELGIVNKPPYFDDYQASKNYAKILFRPGRAIQSRELTQLQTTIQNQLASIGDKVLSSPIISGGDFQIARIKYLRFSSSVDPSFMLNKTVKIGTGNDEVAFKVLHLATVDDEAHENNYAIFFEYKTGKELSFASLTGSQTISAVLVDDEALTEATTTINIAAIPTVGLNASDINGLSIYGDVLLARLSPGVFYRKGFFVVTDQFLSLPLSMDLVTNGGRRYSNYIPSLQNLRVGLKLTPKYVTTEEDPSLFDPSAGYYNFAAPGADRLQLQPSLVKIGDDISDDIIEFIDSVNGEIRATEPSLASTPNFSNDCGGNKILKPFILDIIGSTLNINSGRAIVNCTDIEIVENKAVSLVKESENKRLFNQPFNDQCLSDAIIVQSTSDNPLFGGVTGNDFSAVNTNYYGSGKIRKLFSDEAIRLEIVNCDGVKIGCLTALDIERNSSTSYRLYYNELQSYTTNIPVSSLFSEACTLSLDGEKVFTFSGSIPLTCSDTTPGGARRLVYPVPRGSNIKSVFDADYMITRDFVTDIKSNVSVPYDEGDAATAVATVAEFNMDIPNGVFNDSSTTPNKDMFILVINGKSVPIKEGPDAPCLRIESRTKVVAVLDYPTATNIRSESRASDENGVALTLPTAGKAYLITKVRFPEKAPPTPSANPSSTPIPHRKKRLREARGVYVQNLQINSTISLGFSDIYSLISVKNALGEDITSRFIFDDGQRNDRYDHGSVTAMNASLFSDSEQEYIVEFRYFEHEPISPGFYGPITVNSYGFDESGNPISGFHGKDLNGNQLTLSYDEIPNFLDRVTGEVVSLSDAIDFRMFRTEEGYIENGINKSSILRGRWFPSPESRAAVEASYRLDLPRIDLLVLREDGSFIVLEGESATNPIPPEYPKDGCVIAEINVPGTIVSSEDFIVKKPPIKTIGLPELNDMQSRLAQLEKALSIQTLENKARVQSSVLKNEFLTGMIVDDFGGHYIGDVSNDEYNCSMDFSRGTLRTPFTTTFLSFVPRGSYPKTEIEEENYFVTAPIDMSKPTGVTFVSNTQGTSDVTINSFGTTDWHGYLSLDRPDQLWVDQTTKPIVRNNPRGQNDAWESGGQSVQSSYGRLNGFGTQWAFWKSLWFGETLLSTLDYEKDRASAKSFSDNITNIAPSRFSRSIDRDSLFSPTRKTIGNGGFGLTDSKTSRYVDSSLSFFSPENYIIVRGFGMKPSTTFSVYFENMNIPVSSSRLLSMEGAVLSQIDSDSEGKIEFVLFIPSGSYITGNKVVKVVENSSSTKPSFASAIYNNNGLSWKTIAENDDDSIETEFYSIGRGDVVIKNAKTLYSSTTPMNGVYQRFFIDNKENPYGLILDRIGIYFSQIDGSLPVSVEIRKVNNGVLDSNRIVKNSRIEIIPTNTGYSEFLFKKPVYLSSGEYALCVRTNSEMYRVHISQRGITRVDSVATASENEVLASNVFGVNGFFGGSSLTQTEDTSTTLRFYLKRKSFIANQTKNSIDFTTNTGIFTTQSLSTKTFDLIYFANDNWRTTTGDVQYTLVTDNGIKSISSNTDIEGTDQVTNATIRIGISTTREDISPIVDSRKFGLLLVKNHITKTLDSAEYEELSFGGEQGSAFKYITRRTDLALPANVLRSTVEANIPSNLTVKMFAKVLYEGDLDFDNNSYVPMQLVSGSPSINRDRFGEMVFELDLTDNPKNFVSFCVKIVVTSDILDPNTETIGFYPEIRNLTVVSSVR